MTTSGTFNFNLGGDDLSLEILERVGLMDTAIETRHLVSLRRSVNLTLQTLSNLGVNLWTVDLQTINLSQGVLQYNVDPATVMVLDVYLRIFNMDAPVNRAPAFSTTAGSATVTVKQAGHGLSAGNFVNIIIPVSAGGIVLLGIYQIVSIPSGDTYTITAASNAVSTVSNGGVVPSFTTVQNSKLVTVSLPSHGLLAGQPFIVQVSTLVGGITISGSFTITTVTDANTFTITATIPAVFAATVSENNGNARISAQDRVADPIDRILTPISRSEYAYQPDKLQQAPPTVYWFDRLISPTLTLWQVPDQNGPYQLQFYRYRRIQDSNLLASENPEVHYRFLEALCAGSAAHMSVKWRPERFELLDGIAQKRLNEALREDEELVSIHIQPDFQDYYD